MRAGGHTGRQLGRDGTLAAVIGISSCASLASLAFAPLAPFLVDDLGLGYAAVGALNSALFVAAAVGSPFAGRWVDRMGYGPALTLGAAAMTASFVVAAAAGSAFWRLAALAVTAGVAFAVVNPAANLAVGSGFHPARRGTAMGVKQTGISLGGVLAGALLPAVALAWGWRAALLQVAVLLALASVVSAWAFGLTRGPGRVSAGRWASAAAPRPYALWAGGMLLSCPQALLMTYLVLFVTGEGGVGPAQAGVLFAAMQGAALVGRVALGVVSDFIYAGRRRTVLAGAAVGGAAATAGLALVSPGADVAVAAVAILGGLTAIGWNGVYMAALVDAAPPDAAGSVSGIGVGLNLAGVVLFPLVAGLLLDAGVGFQALWLASAVVAIAAAGAFLRFAELEPRGFVNPPAVA